MGYAIYAARAVSYVSSPCIFGCRRLTSLQQTRLVSLDADRSRRSQSAPIDVIMTTQKRECQRSHLLLQTSGFPRITFSGSWRPFAPILWVYATGALANALGIMYNTQSGFRFWAFSETQRPRGHKKSRGSETPAKVT